MRSEYLIQTPKVSELLLSVAPDVEGLVNPVLNKIDALLTLTELSLLADKAVLHLVFLSSKSQSFTNLSGGSLTWHDSCTFVVAGSLKNRNKKEPSVPYRSVNPATGEVLETFAEHTDEQMWSALAKSDKAFRTWAARPFSERSGFRRCGNSRNSRDSRDRSRNGSSFLFCFHKITSGTRFAFLGFRALWPLTSAGDQLRSALITKYRGEASD
jgi:hypothetical protein